MKIKESESQFNLNPIDEMGLTELAHESAMLALQMVEQRAINNYRETVLNQILKSYCEAEMKLAHEFVKVATCNQWSQEQTQEYFDLFQTKHSFFGRTDMRQIVGSLLKYAERKYSEPHSDETVSNLRDDGLFTLANFLNVKEVAHG